MGESGTGYREMTNNSNIIEMTFTCFRFWI